MLDKDKLKKQVEFLDNNPDYILVGTGGVVVDEMKNKLMDYNVPENESPNIQLRLFKKKNFGRI